MNRILTILILSLTINGFSQESSEKDTSTLTLGAYVDAYYSWYSNASSTTLQQHDCIGAYHNNFGLNVAQFTASYSGDRLRGVATFHFGDIPAITWADQYRPIQEANAGVRLIDELWLDVGFFKTHVGAESFLPKDNLISIISLGTYYGPFYQSGARLNYAKNGWNFELHAVNGYNLHIDNNNYKSFGALTSKQFGERVLVSYSALAGQDNVGQLDDGYLVYQNVYANLNFNKLEVQVGADVATAYGWKVLDEWYDQPLVAALATVKYHFNDQFALAMRGEVFSDESSINSFELVPRAVPINAPSQNEDYIIFNAPNIGMTIYGLTGSFEYQPVESGFLRLETRTLYFPDARFETYPGGYDASVTGLNPMLKWRTQFMVTAGFYFDKSFKFAR